MMWLTVLLGLALVASAVAQDAAAPAKSPEEDQKQAIDHAIAWGTRFRQLHEPVVAAYALAELAGTVCAARPVDGFELFHQSLADLQMLTPRNFTQARHRLPVASFTALWKFVTTAADKCSPDLRQFSDPVRAEAKMKEERQRAPENLRTAFSLVLDEPDRAAQLAEAAMSATDPSLLDIPMLTLLLSRLRDRAADVADELFPGVLGFLTSVDSPNTRHLLQLAEYLFTARKYLDLDDKNQQSDEQKVGGTTVANFEANRRSASSDDVHDYLDAALKVLTSKNNVNYDPVAAYAVAFQMVQKAEDVAPDLAKTLREAVSQIEQMPGAQASQVRSAVASKEGADAEGGEGPRVRDRLVGRVLASASGRRFAEAREMLPGVDDASIRWQVQRLIDYAEASAALEKGDLQWAFTLSRSLPPGIKRALIYAGIAAHAHSRQEALDYYQLALRDIDMLPAEQQMLTLAGWSDVMLRVDAENAYLALTLLVKAANSAYISPHKGKFDPQVVRKTYSGKADTFTDSSLILANRRHMAEVVDTGVGRHSFGLTVPGISNWQLATVLRSARVGDGARVESIVVDVRDESLMAAGLNGLLARQVGELGH